ncbi:hypothetical protein AKH16_07550 [Vibrio parahaemolyticus]|nr:hypothetical protein AKH16_07550 [Vibrio parahaemolyticus]
MSGQSGNAKAVGNKAKKLLKINFKKCLTLKVKALLYAPRLSAKVLKAKLFNNIDLSICVGTR